MKTLQDIKPGDVVVRMLGGCVPMELKVSAVTDSRIVCGAWEFFRDTGAEIDDELGWGNEVTGSFIHPTENLNTYAHKTHFVP